MTMRFKDQLCIVTGAASGIGRATAQRFAAEGALLVLVDRNEAELANVVADLPQARDHSVAVLDIADQDAVSACVSRALERHGRIDVLCNNAGMASSKGSALEQDLAEWDRVMQVNVFGAMLFMKHAGAAMVAARRGAIVNTASVAGIRAGAGGNAYSASKAAVINMTRTAACDFGAYGVRVNAVCPGLIETGMTRPIFEKARELGKEDRLGARCELRRYGHPEEVARVIAFLASEDASYVTGQALAVDGGNTASLNLPGMKV